MPEVQIVLNRIGKRCFVNCFERALQKTDSLTENDILECDPTVGREALDLRKSYIIRIFREEGHFTALKICTEAKIGTKMREKAQSLYNKYK